MAKYSKISDAEWVVMEAVWAKSPLGADDIVKSLGSSGWNPRTIKTMLNRLVKKGALTFDAEGKRYLYRPRVSRETCVRTESRSFLKRIFRGDVGPMLAHFVEDSKLSAQQIKQLRELLEKKGR